ncbi:MAG TPA: helix-turn-helix domain-containing protein [Streptosporangiaceae bacterium]|nr:helix-turn-helix domain-containing protein [Streptosporangiaceae bacterium]
MGKVTEIKPNVLDQNCPSRQALGRLADKWTCLIVYALLDGPRRHGELKRAIGGVSQKMLTQTLRSMEADGLVERTVIDVIPPHVEYRLTPLGQTLASPLVAICQWAMDHLADMQAARAHAAQAYHARETSRDSQQAAGRLAPADPRQVAPRIPVKPIPPY